MGAVCALNTLCSNATGKITMARKFHEPGDKISHKLAEKNAVFVFP